MAIEQNDIIYFILTDRFYAVENPKVKDKIKKDNLNKYHGGNFEGIIEKIPYLKKLGITALWITPVYLQIDLQNVDGYHGYWALDFNKINPVLYIDNGKYPEGSKLYLKNLVDELHKNGIKLILDMVVNHTGYNHPVFTKEENKTPIKNTWFHESGIPLHLDEISGQLAGLPDFDFDNPDVCDYHIQTIISWIKETGIDAIRMDTVKHIERNFWNYFKTQVKGLYPNISLLGEVLVYDIDQLSEYQKYWAFDKLFDFPMQEAIKQVFINDKPMTIFASPFNNGTGILERDKAYTNHNKLVTLLDNHDLASRFFTCILKKQQNDYEKALIINKLALIFLFTTRGVPQLYYGNEIGMQGYHDPDNRRDFPWEIFDKNYEVKSKYKLEKELFKLTRALIKIRKEQSALSSGISICLYVDDFIFVNLKFVNENIIIAVFHNGWEDMPEAVTIDIQKNIHIPLRIKNYLKNRTMKSLLNDKFFIFKDGIIKFQLKAKKAYILI